MSIRKALTTKQLQQWYAKPLGCAIADMLQAELNQFLPQVFGYHLLQMGVWAKTISLERSPILHPIELAHAVRASNLSLVCGNYTALPFLSDSLDLAILSHVLEFEDEPKCILEETCRTLIAEGCLAVICFNPYSLMGLRRLLGRKCEAPWSGHYFSVARLRAWLTELHCEIVHTQRVFFRLPIDHKKFLDESIFLERVGKRFWPKLGAVTVVVAKKKVVTLTPIKPSWETAPVVVSKGLEPTTRGLMRR